LRDVVRHEEIVTDAPVSRQAKIDIRAMMLAAPLEAPRSLRRTRSRVNFASRVSRFGQGRVPHFTLAAMAALVGTSASRSFSIVSSPPSISVALWLAWWPTLYSTVRFSRSGPVTLQLA